MMTSRGSAVGWLLAGMLLLAGCGGEGGNRAHVTGRVTWKGVPVSEGTVNLVPIEGSGAQVGGPIKDGVYEIPQERGPVPGKYRIEVYSFEATAPARGAAEGDMDAGSSTRQVIPAEFNTESQLQLDVDSTKIEKDLELG
jgi:hypothetical protein